MNVNLSSSSASKEIPPFCGNQRLITVFKSDIPLMLPFLMYTKTCHNKSVRQYTLKNYCECGICRYIYPITAFVGALHLSPSWARSVHAHHLFLEDKEYFNIIPSKFGSSKWSLSLRSSHQNKASISPPPIRVAYPTHLILLEFVNRMIFW